MTFVFQNVAPLSTRQVDEAVGFLRRRPVYTGCHVRYAAQGPVYWDSSLDARVLCWHHEDVLRAPHLLAHALEQSRAAAGLLEVDDPVLYSVNVFCTRPDGPLRPDIQDWHRDADDTRFVPLFICLTDGVRQEVREDDGTVHHHYGKAGDAFFSNTMLMHRGLPPAAERIIFWARWGVSDPPAAYKWDQLYPIKNIALPSYPTDERLQRSLRLLVA